MSAAHRLHRLERAKAASASPPRHAENFIPWEQIEPLLTNGMTAAEFARVLRERLGQPKAELITYGNLALSLRECLRSGVWIVSREEAERRRPWKIDPDEVVA